MEIESRWTVRRREQAGVLPTVRIAQPRKTPAQAKLGRGTLESKMNAIIRATRLGQKADDKDSGLPLQD